MLTWSSVPTTLYTTCQIVELCIYSPPMDVVAVIAGADFGSSKLSSVFHFEQRLPTSLYPMLSVVSNCMHG